MISESSDIQDTIISVKRSRPVDTHRLKLMII